MRQAMLIDYIPLPRHRIFRSSQPGSPLHRGCCVMHAAKEARGAGPRVGDRRIMRAPAVTTQHRSARRLQPIGLDSTR